jgi:ribose-phosphate pyrophosphokinase
VRGGVRRTDLPHLVELHVLRRADRDARRATTGPVRRARSRLDLNRLTIVAPDAGGGRRAEAVANNLAAPIAFGYKRRSSDDEVEVIAVSGDVKGRDCVVVEDIITTGSTIAKLAVALRNQGASKVLIAATHPVLTGDAVEKLKRADVDEVIVTDSVPISPEKLGPPITVLSVAPLLAEAIIRVHENRSVSELFR